MAQDTNGVLWIGTFDGLASFDGLELSPVPPAPNAPASGVLTAMVALRHGGIAVTSPAGVHIWAGESWRVVPSQRTALSLAEAADATLWMADVGGAVWTLEANDAWKPHPEMLENALALSSAPDGSVWAATAMGATRLDGFKATAIRAEGLKGTPSAIRVGKDGRVWMATLAGTLHWTRAGESSWRDATFPDWPVGGQIRGLAEDRRGRIWAGTIDGYVAFGNPEIGWTTWGPKNAPLGGIQTILADREGSVWFGMNRNGLAQWAGEAWSHRVAFPEGARPAERTSMTGMTRGQGDHSLLVSGFASGVLRLADGKPPRIWTAAEGITEHARQAVEPEPGALWVAARFGILEARGSSKLAYTLRLKAGFATGLFKSPQGRWYAATSTEGVYSREGNAWLKVPAINQDLDDQHVRGIVWTSTGEMWVETLRGVSVFRDEKVVEKISRTKVAAFPQPVNAVVEAGNGDIWVGGSGGIALRTGSTWRALDMTNGPGPTIYSMAKAPDGAIWAGGANGVGRYKDGRWTTWDSRSGLLEDECNLNGMLIDDDGSVYVGTMGGLARFDPKVEPLPTPVLKLRWLEAPALDREGRAAVSGRDLQLRWSAAWLGSHPVQYRTRAPRIRESWSEPTLSGRLDIQNLGPGLWPVEVQARVEGEAEWTEPLRLDVMVTPYWHETLPARAGLVGLMALAGVGLVRFRLSRLRQHAAALESTVGARTAELADKVALLEVSERRAQAASRAKTTFLANMSHELRTPLNGVLGFAQLMARRPARDPEDRRHLKIILKSGEHLLGLINDVLSMARIEAGETSLNQSAFSPGAVVTSVEQLLRQKADAKGLVLRAEIAPDMPLHVFGDAGKLRQILLNLVGNAIKFTEAGEVIVKASWNAGRAFLEVKDTGPGIAPAEQGALFEPFVQTETGRSSREGTGLGLALSQDLAHLMGGHIRVESVVGQGATFTCEVSLPLAAMGPGVVVAGAESPRVRRLAPGQKEFRVLVVDDVSENRDALSGLLLAVGFEVRSAASGEETLELWRQFRPHLIWMDKRMPGMDGLETTRRIRSEPSHDGPMTRIIVLSASALDHERSEIMQSGCDDFLAKPFREEAIFGKMAELLGARYEYDAPQAAPSAPLPVEGALLDTAPSALAVARRLATLVATGDLAALEAHRELQKTLGPRFADTLREIEVRLNGMDFDSATPLIASLCNSLAQPGPSAPASSASTSVPQ